VCLATLASFLPGPSDRGLQIVLIADVGYRRSIQQMLPKDCDFL